MHDDTLVYFGDAVKALGSGKVGGIVAPFATPETADCQGEYFDASTDFGLDVATKARVVYHHGFTKAHGPRKFGVADLSVGAAGLMGETQLDMADPAAKAIYALAEAGKLYWSSGSTERLVVRQPVKGKSHLASWPVSEVSLTSNPVDKRARAFAVKALVDADVEAGDAVKGEALGGYAGPSATRAAMDRLHEITAYRVQDHMTGRDKEGNPLSKGQRMQGVRACMNEHAEKCSRAADALMDEGADFKAVMAGLGVVAAPGLVERSDQLVADATELAGLFDRAAKSRTAEGRDLSPGKRAAIKALSDSLAALATVPGGKPDPAKLLALRVRMLAGRI